MIRRVLFVAALLSAAPVSAQTATPSPATTRAADAGADAPPPTGIERHCLRETGTMIRSRRARADGRCLSYQAGRVYTDDDLHRTGQTDVAQALRMLDPAIR